LEQAPARWNHHRKRNSRCHVSDQARENSHRRSPRRARGQARPVLAEWRRTRTPQRRAAARVPRWTPMSGTSRQPAQARSPRQPPHRPPPRPPHAQWPVPPPRSTPNGRASHSQKPSTPQPPSGNSPSPPSLDEVSPLTADRWSDWQAATDEVAAQQGCVGFPVRTPNPRRGGPQLAETLSERRAQVAASLRRSESP
jgi:hypothetical protein